MAARSRRWPTTRISGGSAADLAEPVRPRQQQDQRRPLLQRPVHSDQQRLDVGLHVEHGWPARPTPTSISATPVLLHRPRGRPPRHSAQVPGLRPGVRVHRRHLRHQRTTAAQITTLKTKFAAAPYNDAKAAQRYDWTSDNYCPGDQTINGKSDITTTYIVRAPRHHVAGLTDNPAICAISFSPYTGSIYNRLINGGGNVDHHQTPVAGEHALLQVLPPVDRHLLGRQSGRRGLRDPGDDDGEPVQPQLLTTASLTRVAAAPDRRDRDMSIATGGHNRYALRTGWGSSMTGTDLGVYGGGRLPIYVNQNTSSANFFLARIESQYAGMTMGLTFFDIAIPPERHRCR